MLSVFLLHKKRLPNNSFDVVVTLLNWSGVTSQRKKISAIAAIKLLTRGLMDRGLACYPPAISKGEGYPLKKEVLIEGSQELFGVVVSSRVDV